MAGISKVTPSAAIKPVKSNYKDSRDSKNSNKKSVEPEQKDKTIDSGEVVKHIDESV